MSLIEASRRSFGSLSVALFLACGVLSSPSVFAQAKPTVAVPSATPAAVVAGPRWEAVPAVTGITMRQIAVGSAQWIWALDTTNYLWQWNGKSWDKKVCCAAGNLSATRDGGLWATHPANNLAVLRWEKDHWNGAFPKGVITQVAAITQQNTWGLDKDGNNYFLAGTTLTKKVCCVTQLSVANDGSLWAVNAPNSNRVLRWNATKWDENYPPGMAYISAGSANNVWGIDDSHQVFKLAGSAWQKMPGTLNTISVAHDGTIWGIDTKNAVVRYVPN